MKNIWTIDYNSIIINAAENGGAVIKIAFNKSEYQGGFKNIIRIVLDKDLKQRKIYLSMFENDEIITTVIDGK